MLHRPTLRKCALSQSGRSSMHFSASASAWLTLHNFRNEALRFEKMGASSALLTGFHATHPKPLVGKKREIQTSR